MGTVLSTIIIATMLYLILEVDELGFDPADRRMLEAIIESYDGGPVGIDTIAALIAGEIEVLLKIS